MRHVTGWRKLASSGRAFALLLFVLLPSRPARAELYSFVDDEGVVHFTNIPDDPRYRLHPLDGMANTFSWQDEEGRAQRLHRVDIAQFDELVVEAARYYTLPAALVKAVIAAESAFEPAAVSSAGAQGLMQLIPSTAREVFVRDPFDPRDNIFGGTRYLRILANRFAGDLRLTIAAYNAGPEAVERARGVPRIAETQAYVRRVLVLYRHFLETWDRGAQ